MALICPINQFFLWVQDLELSQGEGCGTFIGNGVVKTGVKAGGDMLLASPVLGQRSKRVVMDKNTLFDLTTPFCNKSVELAPAPLSIQLKL